MLALPYSEIESTQSPWDSGSRIEKITSNPGPLLPKPSLIRIRLTFDGYPCNSKCPLVRIDSHLGVVVVNTYLKVISQL